LDKNELLKVLSEEALACCRYEIFAEQADKEKNYYLAKIFRETSKNELSHVREMMGLLEMVKDSKYNLELSIYNESLEASTTYPHLKELALAENELNTARFFQQLTKIEKRHQERFERILKLVQDGMLYQREESIQWKCRTCGYIHDGFEPPRKCPGCQSTFRSFEPEDFNV